LAATILSGDSSRPDHSEYTGLSLLVSELHADPEAAIGSPHAEVTSALIGRVEATASPAQEVGIAVPATFAGPDVMAAGSYLAGSITAIIGRIEALPVVDGSTLLNPASVYGPPSTLSTYVHGEGGGYVTIGEHSLGDLGFLEMDPNARM